MIHTCEQWVGTNLPIKTVLIANLLILVCKDNHFLS